MKFNFLRSSLIVLTMLSSSFANAGLITSDASDYFKSLTTTLTPTTTVSHTATDLWQLGYGTNTSFTQFSTLYYNGLSIYSIGTWPKAIVNTQATSMFAPYGSDVTIPAGGLLLHPANDDSNSAILRFIAPQAGDFNFTSLFTALDIVQTQFNLTKYGSTGDIQTSIYHNSTNLLGAQIIDRTVEVGLQPISFSYTATLSLNKDDTVDFIVGRALDEFWDDSTLLSATVSYNDGKVDVPEPSTLAIFALGLMGLASRRFKKQS
jgi:hypothetical protein